eukprot:g3441.t1
MAKKNFRQIGGSTTKTNGNVSVRRQKSIPGHPRVVPSIPSKYTVRERPKTGLTKQVFGSSAGRFSITEDSLPGPGYYYKPTDYLWREGTIEGVSKSIKGYGSGFVSKAPRFENRRIDSDAPGPGSYSADSPGAWLGRTLPSGKPEYGSNWCKSKRFDGALNQREDIPAPGSYDIDRAFRPRKPFLPVKGTPSFRSKTQRDSVYRALLRKTGPAPGTYDIDRHSWIKRNGGVAGSFKSKTVRNKIPISKNPGPGHYNTSHSFTKKLTNDVNCSKKGTSTFANTKTDRWGVLYERKSKNIVTNSPGPGQYSKGIIKPVTKAKASSSWAVSTTQRGNAKTILNRPPGPVYYRPKLQTKRKSFHLNVGKGWI